MPSLPDIVLITVFAESRVKDSSYLFSRGGGHCTPAKSVVVADVLFVLVLPRLCIILIFWPSSRLYQAAFISPSPRFASASQRNHSSVVTLPLPSHPLITCHISCRTHRGDDTRGRRGRWGCGWGLNPLNNCQYLHLSCTGRSGTGGSAICDHSFIIAITMPV